MSLDGIAGQLAGTDPQLAHFIEVESQKQRFQVCFVFNLHVST